MEFVVLGPIGLRHAASSGELSGRMQQTLLGVLLARANRAVSADALIDAMWAGDRVDRGEQKLQLHVHRLRRALGEKDRLSFGAGGYRLTVRPGELDADRFESLIAEAGELTLEDPARCVELIGAAFELWRGAPYSGLDVPELVDEGHRLADRRLTAVEVLYEAELSRGRDASIIADLTDLVRQHPLRERLCGLLMVALYRAGRQADALRVYREAREALVEGLGLEPGPELRTIERQILSGEPLVIGRPLDQPVARPAQLLADVRGFVGRAAEVAKLDTLASSGDDPAPLVVLTGMAGVGKTALATRWAHHARDRFPDGQLYVDLRGYGPDDPVAPEDALAGFLRALGIDGAGMPQDHDERAARFRSLVDGRRMLVVLDNARSADQVRPLLPGTGSCFVVVTSRQALSGLGVHEGARRVDVGVMSDEEATGLLSRALSDRGDVDPDVVGKLTALCARLPLALRIAAERVRERRGRSVARLAEELADQHAGLDFFDTGEDASASVRAVFSWSYGQLPPEAARLFRRLGLHPGRDIDTYALGSLNGDRDLRTTRKLADTLVRAHLVVEDTAGRYRLHDLLWTYASELARSEDDVTDRDAARRRLVDHYLLVASRAMDLYAPEQGELTGDRPLSEPVAVPPFDDSIGAFAWLDAERANLIALAEWSAAHGDPRDVLGFCALLWCYLDIGWHLDEARRLHTAALAAARDQADGYGEGIARFALGLLYHRSEQNTEALGELERAFALHDEHGDQRMQVFAENYLGAVCHMLDRIEAGTRHFERSLERAQALGQDALIPSPAANLGLVRLWAGQYESALRLLTQALRLAEERDIRWIQARILVNLGEACLETGRYEESLTHLQRAHRLTRGGSLVAQQFNVLHLTGVVHGRLGHHAEGLASHERALMVARGLESESLVATGVNGLAEAHWNLGSVDEAGAAFDEALALAARIDLSFEEARALDGLGDVCAHRGELDQARDQWRRARKIYQRQKSPKADEIAAKLAAADD